MRITVLTLAAIVGAAVTALATPASASNFTVTDIELPYNDTLTITAPAFGSSYVGRQVLTTTAGIINAWCIDLYHDDYVGGGQNLPFVTGSSFTDGQGNTLTAAQTTQITGLINYGDAVLDGKIASPTSSLADLSASIQLAIWSDEYSGFSYNGNQALTDLVAGDMTTSLSYGGNATPLISLSGGQGLVTADPIPEPASMALLGAGILGLGVLRRRQAVPASTTAA